MAALAAYSFHTTGDSPLTQLAPFVSGYTQGSKETLAQVAVNPREYFNLGFASSEAVLYSNILQVDQEKTMVMEFPMNITAPGFLEIVYANEGATVVIRDKGGFERTTGFMNIDDRIVVIAPDGITEVTYRFSEDFTVSVERRVKPLFDVVIFPNPVSTVLNIKGFELAAVQVYSISGTMMISESASYSNRLDVSNLPDGIYVIKMTDVKGRVAIDKFLKR